MYTVNEKSVWEMLQPALGTRLLVSSGVTKQIAHSLSRYTPSRDILSQLSQDINDLLFTALYQVRMHPLMDNGTYHHIHTDDLYELADNCLFVLFSTLERSQTNYQLLSQYAIQYGSRSAQSAIYLFFRQFSSEEETALLKKILSSRFTVLPPWLVNDQF